MSKTLLCSDLHLGHEGVIRFRKNFTTAEEHHNIIFDNVASSLTKRDTLLVLGDIAFNTEWLKKFISINCQKKIIIPGNHDMPIKTWAALGFFDNPSNQMFAFHSMKGAWFSHCPIHPDEIRNRRGNVHGHTHYHNINDSRYFNASMENLPDWKPVNLQDVLAMLPQKT